MSTPDTEPRGLCSYCHHPLGDAFDSEDHACLRPLRERLAAAQPQPEPTPEGCDCTELCDMGPTCPGGMLARLPGSGCWRTDAPEVVQDDGEWPCGNYQRPITCLTTPKRMTLPCDWCRALPNADEVQALYPDAQRDAEVAATARADALTEAADELRRVFLRLPHTPSPLGDFIQRRYKALRDEATRLRATGRAT